MKLASYWIHTALNVSLLAVLVNLPTPVAAQEGEEHAHEPEAMAENHHHEEPTADASEAHDHATDHGEPAGIGRLIRFLGKFHPVVIHFPIALIALAAFAELLAIRSGKSSFSDTAFFILAAGATSAVTTVALGWAAGAFADYQEELAGVAVLSIHRWLGTASGVLILLTLGLALRARKSPSPEKIKAYRASLFVSAALVSVAAHFGASLIYGLDYFIN